jgi:hypothetical protein
MTPLATHDYRPGELEAVLEFLKRTRSELRELHRVRVWPDRVRLIDVNKDCFEVRGIGYPDPDIIPLLRFVNTNFDPETIHKPVEVEYKEFAAGRRWAWANDRVM